MTFEMKLKDEYFEGYNTKLEELIVKKLKKGKPIPVIANELEESAEVIETYLYKINILFQY